MVMEVPGKRRRGRPKRRWLDSIRNDLSQRELSGEEAQDLVIWRRLIRITDPTYKWDKSCQVDHVKLFESVTSLDLLLLSCPSHNFLPLAGASLCPLCHCVQVVP